MMYKTHKEVGKVFFIVSLPIAIQTGLIPSIFSSMGNGVVQTLKTLIYLITTLVVGYHGAIWGAGYPDLDSQGSTPDRRNPILGKIIRAFGVKHRGKFSHSLDSITLTFGIVLLTVRNLLPLVILNSAFKDIAIVELFLKNGIINGLVQVWIMFAYVGAISHLFGDASTKSGIRIFFFLKPFRIVPNMRFFRTGDDSIWEKFYRDLFKVLIPISVLSTLYVLLK